MPEIAEPTIQEPIATSSPAPEPSAPPPTSAPPTSASPANLLAPNREVSMKDRLEALRQLSPTKKAASSPKPVAENKKQEKPAPTEEIKKSEAKTEVIGEPDKPTEPRDWKLLNTFKSENAKLKKQLEQFTASDSEKKELAEQLVAHRKDLEAARSEKKRIEDLLKFRDYQNTDDFQSKYVQPWEAANSEAESSLQGIKITDDSGNEQAITMADIQKFADMDIPTARETIRRLVPDVQDASDVRRHTDSIRMLKEKHKVALEKAWTDSDKWQKDQQSKYQQSISERDNAFKAIHEENTNFFKQYDQEARAKFEYLKPIEGDDEWNQKIEQAESFVDESLASNPNDPRLSKEARSEMIRRNTAVIHRSKMFGPLKLENKRLKAKNSELQKKIDAYGSSEPKPGNGQDKRTTSPVTSANPMEAMKQRFRQYVT